MKFRLNFQMNKIVDFLVIALLCSFTILTTYSWGRYLMIICLAGIFILDAAQSGFKYKVVLSRFVITVALLSLYAFFSMLWAQNPSDAFVQGRTLFELLMMIFVLEHYYRNRSENVAGLLSIIKWSGFIIVIYSILFYGLDTLIYMSASEERMDNTYANINTIGILAAVGTVIQIDEMIREKRWKLAGFMCIPSVFLLALTQSRKALVILLAGTFMSFVMRNNGSKKNFGKNIIKIIFSVIIAFALIYALLSLPVFSGVLERMETLFAVFGDGDKVDYSTRLRNRMMEVGWEQFLETPLFGIGMGNAHLLAAEKLGEDTYLHNNFIELLAGGGLAGFLIYYSMYAYLFVNFWRYRKYKNTEFILCFIIMLVLFCMDFGRVSYYTKMNYIFLLLYFLEAETLRKRSRQVSERTVDG